MEREESFEKAAQIFEELKSQDYEYIRYVIEYLKIQLDLQKPQPKKVVQDYPAEIELKLIDSILKRLYKKIIENPHDEKLFTDKLLYEHRRKWLVDNFNLI